MNLNRFWKTVFMLVFKMLYKQTRILVGLLLIHLKKLPDAGCSPSCWKSPESFLLTFLRKTTGAFAGTLKRIHRASFSQTSHFICVHISETD